MSRIVLQEIIKNFDIEKFIQFFRLKNDVLIFPNQPFPIEEDGFTEAKMLAKGKLEDEKTIIVCSFLTEQPLSERAGKKAQYELGKKILKETQTDGGIFIFYDIQGSFRFSLIYASYLGTKRGWSNFRRFTYYVNKEQTNKTFLQRIGEGDLSNLERIKEAFSVDKVSKEFYQEIANWYFWAIQMAKFPEDAEQEKNGRNIAIIRLITRMIFIWFMKVRDLIPDELFSQDRIKEILKDSSCDETTFYKAILQNLFFATLNTKQDNRKFRSEERNYKGFNPDFGNHNVYRYHNLFKEPEKIQTYFERIPFLNGGLFDCLDFKTKNKEERFYIDGFTDTKQFQPYVPNFLFFSEEKNIDLNKEYGTKGKRYEVRGLIDIFSSYNFTIDENEPDDFEIALDPELLGRVFENLLACYNPETATTARKATGSYNTPREIVDYMVTESLNNYLKTNLNDIPNIDNLLSKLFSKEDHNNPFDKTISKKIVSLVENLRIVDPAVGSGAFPMGILNKLVFILSKVDPENVIWKQVQIETIKSNVKTYSLKEQLLQHIEEYFRNKDINYLRKLFLIEKCIYGVDIQQIAVEIAKLRFFISLLVDEKIDKTKENYGIEPLPNLNFKLMQGNSLISSFFGINFGNLHQEHQKSQLSLNFKTKYNELIGQYRDIKNHYQNEPEKKKRDVLLQEVEEYLIQILEEKIKEHVPELRAIEEKSGKIRNLEERKKYLTAEKKNLVKRLSFDLEGIQKEFIAYTKGRKPKNFFLWDIYFAEVFAGENPGFDIVIGNPPYIQLQKACDNKGKYADLYKDCGYQTFDRTGDIYCLFYEKGVQILKEKGVLAYISSNKWMRTSYGEKIREYFTKFNPKILIDLGPGVFESATVDTNIIVIQNTPSFDQFQLRSLILNKESNKEIDISQQLTEKGITLEKLTKDIWFIGAKEERHLKEKIENIGKPLKDWNVNIYRGILTGLNKAFIITSQKRNEILSNCYDTAERRRTELIIKPILRGKDINRYHYQWANLWIIVIPAGWTNANKQNLPAEKFIRQQFPALIDYFKPFKEKAIKRDDKGDYWWELRPCSYYSEFEKNKIVWQELAQGARFFLDDKGEIFVTNTAYILTGEKLKYLLGYLNSKLNEYSYERWYCTKLGHSGTRWLNQHVELIPVPPQNYENRLIIQKIEELVGKILNTKADNLKTDTMHWELEIDRLVYELYGLNEEEIKLIGQAMTKK